MAKHPQALLELSLPRLQQSFQYLAFVAASVYLGSSVVASISVPQSPCMQQRIMKSAYAQRKRVNIHAIRGVLREPTIPVPVRVNVVLTHIVSKPFYQAGAWADLNNASHTKLHDLIMEGYRRIAGADCHNLQKKSLPYVNDKDVVSKIGALAPELLIVLARLMRLARIWVKCPSFYFTLMHIPFKSK